MLFLLTELLADLSLFSVHITVRSAQGLYTAGGVMRAGGSNQGWCPEGDLARDNLRNDHNCNISPCTSQSC